MIRDLLRDASAEPVGPVVIAMVIGALIGGTLGFLSADHVQRDYDTREKLRAACIGGSDQACRIYEVDYARGAL